MDFSKVNIVSIDDNENNLMLIEAICMEMGANIQSFLDPLDGLMYVLQNEVDIIVIDYMMPNLNGIEFIKEYRTINKLVPIVMVTAAGSDDEVHKNAFDAGVNDFLAKPIKSILFKARITTLLNNYKSQLLLKDRAKLLEQEVEKATKELANREYEALNILGKTAEYKDPETAFHVARVAHYSKLLAQRYGLSKEEQEIIYHASSFHDLGKVGIEDKILLKPARLDDDEYEIMKQHALIGYDILKDSKSKFLQAGAAIALSHHERFDGSGYPYNIKGEEIHIFGRIVSIADVFDALTSTRPYKKAWSFEDALQFLKEESGKHFDPKIVDLFLENIDEIKQIYTRFSEETKS